MKIKSFINLSAFLMLAGFLMVGCNKKNLVYSETAEPEGFVLSFQKPEVFSFNLEEGGNFSMALELVYFSEQMQNLGGSLPMYYILEGPGLGEGKDRKFEVKVLNSDGEWRGDLQENDHDRLFEDTFEKDLQLEAGEFKLKLYADSQTQGEPVQGMVSITLKIYQ